MELERSRNKLHLNGLSYWLYGTLASQPPQWLTRKGDGTFTAGHMIFTMPGRVACRLETQDGQLVGRRDADPVGGGGGPEDALDG